MNLHPESSGWGYNAFCTWYEIVCDAISCWDFDNRRWAILPEAGGLYDQDEWIMKVWKCVINTYYEVLRKPEVQKQIKMEQQKCQK